MESIRLSIHKQLGRDGMIPIITYPQESTYDFRLHNDMEDMKNISSNSAYNIRIYPDGKNIQATLIESIDQGLIEFAILIDTSHKTVEGNLVIEMLGKLAKAYDTMAADDPQPRNNKAFMQAVKEIYQKLSENAMPGYPTPLKVAKEDSGEPLTYYMQYKTTGEVATLMHYPDQEFFDRTSSVFLIPDNVTPSFPRQCKHVHSLVLRTFKIKSPQGYEYGQVKEGETVKIHLKGKEGMLPMTAEVAGDVTKPSPYGYFDTTTNTIRIDERAIKFYYELKFIVKFNGRQLRSCLVRYHGDQIIPDSNGCYLVKVFEDQVNDAGYIHFSGEGFKDADIQVTPGIVKQQEYVFTPEPQHGLTRVILDFNDGRPISTTVDVGTNDRLFHQLEGGKVKGYPVKKRGEEYHIMIPRKLTKASKNTLRLLKFGFMVLFTLAAYSLATWLFTQHWPWPIEQATTTTKPATVKQKVNEDGVVTKVEDDDDDGGLIINDDDDQFALEKADNDYLKTHDIWRKDSIRSNKYQEALNTIYNGSISEIRQKGYNGKVIDNDLWSKIWTDFIVPNNVKTHKAKEIFEQITKDHNTLNLQKLYEKLSSSALTTGDVAYPSSTTQPSNRQNARKDIQTNKTEQSTKSQQDKPVVHSTTLPGSSQQ